eukprot:TRINITY_DN1484_c0_g1_i3.p1 TRINITY_DN1484_c0_g1~~TRINITY_DN1484_c0_g1_i3.p1  ORF type:complete len:206 (-),score=0.22 TRINITY_DN1484_c0_g1_i3:31-648(-)
MCIRDSCQSDNNAQSVHADFRTLVESNGGSLGVPFSTTKVTGGRPGSRLGSRAASRKLLSAACTPAYPVSACFYPAEVLHPVLSKPGSGELTVFKGEKVFVLQDAPNRHFQAVNGDGCMGRVPCHFLKFLQPVPAGRLQHASNGLGPSLATTNLSLGDTTEIQNNLSSSQALSSLGGGRIDSEKCSRAGTPSVGKHVDFDLDSRT